MVDNYRFIGLYNIAILDVSLYFGNMLCRLEGLYNWGY